MPAALTICPPFFGLSSILCTAVPSGIFSKGREFPTSIGALGPDNICVPIFKVRGYNIYLFSPSL